MAVQLGITLDSGASQAAQQFIALLAGQQQAAISLSKGLAKLDEQGNVLSQTFKGLAADGTKFVATVKETTSGYELMSASVDKASASLKELRKSQEAAAKAPRIADANAAESQINVGAKNTSGYNANQVNSFESAMRRIKGTIESGSVSLQRFQEIYNAIASNPKGILPNLTDQEAIISKNLRNMIVGFDEVGEKAKRAGGALLISFSGAARLFEAQVIKRATGALQSAFVESITSATDFSIKIAEVATISQTSGVSIDQLSKQTRDLSSAFGNSQLDVAEATYQALSNQVVNAADSQAFLATALKFGLATVSTAKDSVNLLSGAIKSFGLNSTDAERVGAIFFKTVEQGRVRAGELSDIFGRIGPVAAASGVKLEEVAAAIATLTVKGTSSAEAITLISNLLQKIIKPTAELKNLFTGLGFASGQAAISTLGFGGVLQLLEKESMKSASSSGELLGSIRAMRASLGLTGPAFADYANNLSKISNGSEAFNKAADMVSNSAGKKIRDEMNRIKNVFSEGFGDRFIEGFSVLNDKMGGFANAIVNYGDKVKDFLVLLAAVKIASALGLGGPVGAAAGGGFALGNALFTSPNIDDTRRQAGIDSMKNTEKQSREDTGNTNREQNVIAAVTRENTLRQRILLEGSRSAIELSGKTREATIADLKATTEALKINAKSYFDTLNSALTEYKQAVSEAARLTHESLKSSEDLARKAGQTMFDTKLKYSSEGNFDVSGHIVGEQKTALIKSRIQELTQLARDKFQEGTKESVDEARKLFSDVEKLQSQLFDNNTAIRKREFEANIAKGIVAPSGVGFDPATGQYKARYDFIVKTSEFEKIITAQKDEQLALEEKFRALQAERKAGAEAEIAAQKEKLRLLEQSLKNLEAIALFDKTGKVKPEFKKDPTKAMEQFDKEADAIKTLSSGSSAAETAALYRSLAADRKALLAELNAASMEDDAKAKQAELIKINEDAMKEVNARRSAFDTVKQAIKTQIIELDKDVAGLTKGSEFGLGSNNLTQAVVKRSVDGVIELKAASNELELNKAKYESARNDFLQDQSPEKLALVKEAYDKLKVSVIEFQALFQQTETTKAKLPGDASGRTVKELADAASKKLTEINALLASKEEQLNKLNEGPAQDKARQKIEELPEAMDIAKRLVSEGSVQIGEAIGTNIGAGVEQAKVKIAELQDAINAINLGPLGGGGGAPDAPGNMFGGKPRYFWGGGPVSWTPRSMDRIPAMLGSDETVMTGRATNAFAPILKAMNDGVYRNPSQNNTTNIGDIHLNVSGMGMDNEVNVRKLGQALRREIRRGTVQLS